MGAERRRGAFPWLAAGEWLHSPSLDRLRRRAAALPARPRFADVSPADRKLCRLLFDLPVEGELWPRAALLGAALYPPALAPLDRLPRHPGRVHARARQRLLSE